MDVQFEALEQWPDGHEPAEYRERSRFRASYSETLELLDRELRHIGADSVVLQVDVDPGQIRLDGHLYARATPRSPGVVLSFELGEDHFMYPCDTYADWRDNLRAIALTLEKLRAVDRYGVSKHGEQYRGWRAIPADVDAQVTPHDAAVVVLRTAGGYQGTQEEVERLLSDAEFRRRTVRRALAMAHPDRNGGTGAHFERVKMAREVLEGAAE